MVLKSDPGQLGDEAECLEQRGTRGTNRAHLNHRSRGPHPQTNVYQELPVQGGLSSVLRAYGRRAARHCPTPEISLLDDLSFERLFVLQELSSAFHLVAVAVGDEQVLVSPELGLVLECPLL